jgi:alginate O-acetyltransferase complex protein AlgI
MVFTSTIFLYAFLPAFLALYALAPRVLRSALITVGSFVFYGWWNPSFVLLLFASSAIDYWLGGRIVKDRADGRGTGRRWLVLSMVANLSLLGWFKYANFGIATFRALLHSLGFAGDFPWVDVVLPVGISFYTFQTMSYTIDVYRGEVKTAASFVDFLCYVSMFPQLVAGPIVRYAVVEHELQHRVHSLAKFQRGILFFQAGMVKKLLLADALAPLADAAFSTPDASSLATGDAWLGILAYTFQIYFDAPYRSTSITEFWRRWHISLSTWLRDYLYVSLGGNRRGTLRTYANLMATMLLGGLWHGAAWNFVAWGGYQGTWLVLERLAGKRPFYGRAPAIVRAALTFLIVVVGWVLFRARDLGHAGTYLATMAGAGSGPSMQLVTGAPLLELLIAAVVAWTMPTSQRAVARAHPAFVLLLQLLFVFAALHLRAAPENIPFLYFQF